MISEVNAPLKETIVITSQIQEKSQRKKFLFFAMLTEFHRNGIPRQS